MRSAKVEDVCRLSPVQQGMLFHCLAAPEAGQYFEQVTLKLSAELDIALFRRTWQTLLEAHPTLRTSFLWQGLDEPLQAVYKRARLPLAVLDARGLRREDLEPFLRRLLERDRRRGLAPGELPLLRWTLVRTSATEYCALWSYHHLLLDGWSVLSLLEEGGALYRELAAGRETKTSPRRPYRDYIAWLRKQDLPAAREHWRKALAGFHGATRLAIDRGGDGPPGAHGICQRILGPETVHKLVAHARAERLTLSTLVTGAWALTLACYSGETRVTFGVTVSGRPPAITGVEAMLGCFINTLPLQIDAAGVRGLRAWLGEVQRQQVAMRPFEFTPLPEVRRAIGVAGDRPLFESILVFENFDAKFAARPDHPERIQRTNFPLVALAEPEGETLRLRLGFDAARFSAAAVENLLATFAHLLAALPAHGDRRLAELPAFNEHERRRLHVEWNQGEPPYPEGPPVTVMFSEHAAATPDRIAAAYHEDHLSYGELEARSAVQARRLLARGALCEHIVAVALDRSLDAFTAVLGTLRAGAVYLPLDLELPAERLALMLADAQGEHQPHWLLTSADRLERLTALSPVAAVVVGTGEAREMAAEAGTATLPELEPEAAAYVIYTSGSTGKPKGVVISHHALANRMQWARCLDMPPGCRWLHKTSSSFDVSLLEIFLPLVCGGTSVVARPGGQRDPAYLMPLLRDLHVTHASFPATVYPLLLAEPAFAECRSLEALYVAGEAVPAGLADRIRERLEVRVDNRYGPTEATIGVLAHRLDTGHEREAPPIGHPIAGTRVYITGRHLEPLPAGAPGELLIAGVGLARGYLHRPGLTAERFVPDAFSGEPGGRLYRSGDLARWREDGVVEYLGRVDRQVKVRGYRIELGEIEAALLDHPRVREAAVVDHPDAATGGRRLVGYFVAAPDKALSGAPLAGTELEAYLELALPEYMVPRLWLELAALPRSASLKVDRDALPAPAAAERAPARAATNELERELVEIWRAALGADEIGIEDDFYALGGDSLTLMRLHAKLRERYPASPDLLALARIGTVARLARAIRGEGEAPRVVSAAFLRAEAELEAEIRPVTTPSGAAATEASSEGAPTLLTGATGFLGAHLLAELLRQTGSRVLCLVRAESVEAGQARLREALAAHGLWRQAFADRVVALPGDLGRPRLGLSAARLDELAASLGAIYHNGAVVDLVRPYEALRGANVEATRELLRLACRGRVKPFHYISSLSVFETAACHRRGVVREEDDSDDPAGLTGGYMESKWVAERLVVAARERGVPVTIHRPGILAGGVETGAVNRGDFALALFRGAIELAAVPASWNGVARVTPVDFVARAIVWLSLQAFSLGRAFHPLHPRTTTVEALLELLRGMGYALPRVADAEWRRRLASEVAAGRAPALAPYAPLFARGGDGGGDGGAGEATVRPRPRFECGATTAALAVGGFAPLAEPESLARALIARWIEDGFFPPPTGSPAAGEDLAAAGVTDRARQPMESVAP